jgi:hypothetical protein
MTNPDTHDYKSLVLTLRINDDGEGDAIELMAHNPHGPPIPIYIELGNRMRSCRCGQGINRAKVRIIAPKVIAVNRVKHSLVPSKDNPRGIRGEFI